ncbi:uncharacterized protein LOC144115565 [Amblyomma americanum]
MVFGPDVVSSLALFTLLLKVGLLLLQLFANRGRPYTAAETEEILGGLVRALILLMCHNEEERKRYIHLHTLAGTLCEFFGLVYLLDFITARQTESMSILQCAVPRMTSVRPAKSSVAPPTSPTANH